MKKHKIFCFGIVICIMFLITSLNVSAATSTFCIADTVNGPQWFEGYVGITWEDWFGKIVGGGGTVPEGFSYKEGGYVYYNSYRLLFDSEYVLASDTQQSKTYYLEECEHSYQCKEYPTPCESYTSYYTCMNCEHEYSEFHEASFEDHSYIINVLSSKASTCSTKGYNLYDCSLCGNYTIIELELDAENHTYSEATCTVGKNV